MTFTRSILLSLVLGLTAFIRAQDLSPADNAFERFRHGTLDAATLAEVLPQLINTERRQIIRSTILEAKSPPREAMVSLLDHPILAVRLGSLELLEELAGGDFSYNPWTPAESPENLGALAQWKTWTGKSTDTPRTGGIFSEEQRRGYLRDLLADDNDKAMRARKMLEAEGLSAAGFLESFLIQTPSLPAGGRTRIREAQYQIALARQLGDQAAVTARQLAFGSRDQQLSAIETTRTAGMLAIPILRDFITHPDPLVRETAIDSLLVSAGTQAVTLIAPLLATETDVNVIHGVLRRLKDIKSNETKKLVTSFLTHPDEDLLVSAIQTSLTLTGDNDSYPSGTKEKSDEADKAILKCLSDPRWRVRASALEYIAKRKLLKAEDKCLELLDDSDSFVRFAAINASVAIGSKNVLSKLKTIFLAENEMIAPIIEAYGTMNAQLDSDILAKLDASPPDTRVVAIRASGSHKSLNALSIRYATDANLDVACAALRAIAADEEKLKQNKFASVIAQALLENNPVKNSAILEQLKLPSSSSDRVDPVLLNANVPIAAANEPTTLDPIYTAFKAPGTNSNPAVIERSNAPNIPAAQAEILRGLTKFLTPDSQPGLRFGAAVNLAKAGQAAGYTALIRDLPNLNPAQKTAICESISSPNASEAIPLLTALLRDPVPEVRSAAVESALSNEKSKALISLVLRELEKSDTPLQPREVYSYRFDNCARRCISVFRPWCLSVLQSDSTSTAQKILASIAARHTANSAIIEALRKHTISKDATLRRAAWHALISARPAEFASNAQAIANDPDAFVRAVLPDRAIKAHYTWSHHFSDTHITRDNYYNYNEKKNRPDEKTSVILGRLARQDPSPVIRFEAGFSLLGNSEPIDLDAFVSLLPRLSKETNAVSRISEWLEENASRATPALRPLLAFIDPKKIQAEKLKILNTRINPSQTKGILTFASLAENLGKSEAKGTPILTEETQTPPPTRTSLEVVYFYKPGCPECVKVKQYLDSLKNDFPLIKLEEHNILESSGIILNQALCARLSVPSIKHTVSPSVFTQSGFVIGAEISPAALGKLLARTMQNDQNDAWNKLAQPEQIAAAKEVDRRYENITLPIVLVGGLLDGVNPCAFATIIFFLSYLQIARRTPREMLMVGAAFILAVFIAYLAAGLLLYQVLDALNDRFAGIQKWMNIVFGLLALFAAWLSLRDALRARSGRLDEMTLQLPSLLKDRIRNVIRSGARARNFVIAAFFSGLIISLLELACTGQVYAPIIYQIQKGRLDAVLWLVIYNLAFITPLIVIFLLAYGGLRSEKLITFQKNHTFAVKLGLALLFLSLAFFILFGSKLLPH